MMHDIPIKRTFVMKKYLMVTTALLLSTQAAQAAGLTSQGEDWGFSDANLKKEEAFIRSPKADEFRNRMTAVRRQMEKREKEIKAERAAVNAQRVAQGERSYEEMDKTDPQYVPLSYINDPQYAALDKQLDEIYAETRAFRS